MHYVELRGIRAPQPWPKPGISKHMECSLYLEHLSDKSWPDPKIQAAKRLKAHTTYEVWVLNSKPQTSSHNL